MARTLASWFTLKSTVMCNGINNMRLTCSEFVLEPPRFSVQSQSQVAHKNKPVHLLCQPDGDRPIRMEWSLLNGTLLNELLLSRDKHRTSADSDDENNDSFAFE